MNKILFLCTAAVLAVGFNGNAEVSPRRADIPQLYGCVEYSEKLGGNFRGIYKLPLSADGTFSPVKTSNFDIIFNGVEKDGVYYIHTANSLFGSYSYYIKGVDIQTGNFVYTAFNNLGNGHVGADLAADPVSGNIYGIFNNVSGDGYRLGTITYEAGEDLQNGVVTVEAIGAMPGEWNALACDNTGQLYAISKGADSKLYKVDKNTAAVTEIGSTGVNPYYVGSATIDPKTNRMFWTVSLQDHSGKLYEVDLTTGRATHLLDFSGNEQVTGLVIPSAAAEDGAPAIAKDLSLDFPNGALRGKVNFTAPVTTYDGSPASGQISYKVSVDGNDFTGTTSYGAKVSADVEVGEAATYSFTVTTSNAVGTSPKAVVKGFVGPGVPNAPENVKASYADGVVTVTWDPVTESSNGGYIDPKNVTYNVTKGNTVITQNQKETTYTENVTLTDGLTVCKYSVSATYGSRTSASTAANDLVFGSIIPPYKQTFDTESSLTEFTNISSTGYKWEFFNNENQGQEMPRVRYSFTKDMDAWLITAPVKLEGGKAYRVNLDAYATATSSKERIEIKFGTAPTAEAMTQTLVEPTTVAGKDATPLEGYLTAPADGNYYIGIHGISDKEQAYLFIDNLEIAEGVSAAAPVAVDDLKVLPGANGAKEATVSFIAPSKDFLGNPISSVSKIEVLCGDEVIETFTNVAAGTQKSFKHTLSAAGDYTYTVIPYTAGVAGQKASVTVYVGFPLPADLKEAFFKETSVPGEVTVTWTPVTTDINGQPLDASLITYAICEVGENGAGKTLYDGLQGTSKTFRAIPEGEKQEFVQFMVFAETEKGRSAGVTTNLLPVGPDMTSFQESFPNGAPTTPLETGYENNGGWMLLQDRNDIQSADGDNGFAAMYSATGGSAGLFTGKISLANFLNPALTFYVYNWSDATTKDLNEISVDVSEVGTNVWRTVNTIKINELGGNVEGWYQASVSLAAYAGKKVQIKLQASSLNFQYVLVDNIRLISLIDNDINARSITAPSKIAAGGRFSLQVEIANEGGKTASGHSVDLYADGKLLESKNCKDLASGDKEMVSFNITMHPLAEKLVEYYAQVSFAADQNMANNTTDKVYVEPIVSTLPTVSDLKGVKTAEGRMLSWSEPSLGGANSITENFDAKAWEHSLEGWIFVDKDNAPLAGLSDGRKPIDIPGITPNVTKASFFTFDNSLIIPLDTDPTALAAISGSNTLVSMAPATGATDDWAISPELSGEPQTISFYALCLQSSNPEKLCVLYSTGSTNPDDFTAVKTLTRQITEKWNKFEIQLPAGAKRFALNSCAMNGMMLVIDDVTFSTRYDDPARLTLSGFNVFRNGEKINNELVEDFEYLDSDPMPAIGARYVITAVYEEGESRGSNAVEIDFTAVDEIEGNTVTINAVLGNIIIKGADGAHVTVVSYDGKVIFSGIGDAETNVSVTSGIYIVRAGSKTAKLIVR
jgi:cleaved adhesin domain protein